MYRIAGNLVIDQVRQARTQRHDHHQSLDENVRALPCTGGKPEEWLARQQALERTRDAILALPERCQQIYLLNRIEGMSYTQIARHCGITLKAVEKQITKALSLLRKQLGDTVRETF
jgi:RNA polymerase sigma-70 factor (ECF subfamily)